MATASPIRILEADNNKRGDLFGRLMTDLFLALGYEKSARLNVHKSGRELDLDAEHRTERRRAIAECKATAEKIGGDDVNKFVGTLDAEQRRAKGQEVVGYVVSLSGFRETAIQQEDDLDNDRVVLLNGTQVIGQLIKGHIIKSEQAAMELAGRCAATQSSALLPETTPELLAHDLGWIWAVYFTTHKQRTHFALIHADGEALAPQLAAALIAADKSVEGELHTLTYLAPSAAQMLPEQQLDKARDAYFAYLARECGEIQLEGMPADEQAGSRRLNLENIFVPLHLESAEEPIQEPGIQAAVEMLKPDVPYADFSTLDRRPSVGQVLSKFSRLAILGLPGGGKSTLLKRLAVAYAFPARRSLIDDELPDKPWLPLFIRCRQLEQLVKSPITTILREIPKRAEMDNDTAAAFAAFVNRALRSGDVLLLIDGLDEISEESARVAFIHQLRTFLATYPQVNTVVTSREAGFRIVGGALSTLCQHFKLAEFDDDNIKRLTRAWHKEIVGDKPDVRADAESLAETICTTDRVRRLAQNPLLLTTLLLVKRWVGQLPTRRSILYAKALEVLLMTWNVEGYEPLDPEEINPQLEFIAYTMMQEGIQRISAKRLRETLLLARQQMPEVLGYARVNVNEFIERVELRSSILMLSGHEVEDGTLYPMYEFRHLTFQEYLTARAIVEGHYPNRKDSDTLLDILKPHLNEEEWSEVIPLAAVLSGRRVQPLIRHLIAECEAMNSQNPLLYVFKPANLLGQCILDEVQIPPDLLADALKWVARYVDPDPFATSMYKSKYCDLFFEICRSDFKNGQSGLGNPGSMLGVITLHRLGMNPEQLFSFEAIKQLDTLWLDADPIQRAIGSMLVAVTIRSYVIHRLKEVDNHAEESVYIMGDRLFIALSEEEYHVQFAAAYAYAFLGLHKRWTPRHKPEVISRLIQLWGESQIEEIKMTARDAILLLPLLPRDMVSPPRLNSAWLNYMKTQLSIDTNVLDLTRIAILKVSFYLRSPWSDQELARLVAEQFPENYFLDVNFALEELGEYGEPYLEKIRQEQDKANSTQPIIEE